LYTFEQNFGKMSIGGKVRKFRIQKGISQHILAENANVSQSIISSLESDKSIPNSIMLNRIAKELDVDINELLADENIVQNNSDNAIGNIHSQVTINNHFPENILEILLFNQEKITNLIEIQNRLIEEAFLKKQ
jgi:transcriptional regulator with XRE-family HTH domain